MKPIARFVALGLLTTLFSVGCSGGGGYGGSSPATYTVTYNGNGATGGTAPADTNAYKAGHTVTVLGNTGGLSKDGSTFAGWSTAADGTGIPYTPGQTFLMGTADVTLYAQWSNVTGTVSGTTFTTMDAEAVLAGPATCTVPVLGSIEARAFAIRFASYADVCSDFASPFCTLHKSAESVTVIFADLSQSTLVPTGLAPGTYTVYPDPSIAIPQTSGPLANTAVVAFTASLLTDSVCTPTPTVAEGTLRIDSVTDTATIIAGHIDLTLGTYDSGTQMFTPGAGSVSGDFFVPVCSGATISNDDLCAIAVTGPACSDTPTCN